MKNKTFISQDHKHLTQEFCKAKRALRSYLQKQFPAGAECTVSAGLEQAKAIVLAVEANEQGGVVRLKKIPCPDLAKVKHDVQAKPVLVRIT